MLNDNSGYAFNALYIYRYMVPEISQNYW